MGKVKEFKKGKEKILTISKPSQVKGYIFQKGYVAINGISLTVSNSTNSSFSVSLIPETIERTNLSEIKKGDYLGLLGSASATSAEPIQYVMAVEDATLTTQSGDKDNISVAIQPKLRSDFAGKYVRFANPKGTFRLISNEVSWSADRLSNYGISFAIQEVI